jgi:hypothetical protein
MIIWRLKLGAVTVPAMALEVWANIIQTVAVVLGAGAVAFAWRQVRLARHGGGGANVLDLWAFLQGDQARAQRSILYEVAKDKGPFVAGRDLQGPHSWTNEEIEAAAHVAQVLSVAGALAKHDYIPLDLLIDEWGPMIVRTWTLVRPVMVLERKRRSDPKHNYNYEWVAHKCGFNGPYL